MAKLDGLETVLDFLKELQPKIAAQIAKKVLALNVDPLPADSKELTGYPGFHRVDSGEYRIVYRFDASEDLVEVIRVQAAQTLHGLNKLVSNVDTCDRS